MPFQLPPHASAPDDDREDNFVPLANTEPIIAKELIARFSQRWLALAELRPDASDDAEETVELKVAYMGNSKADTELRLRSWYTGSTYWLPDWDESIDSAMAWIDNIADLQAGNALVDRRHGQRLWEANPKFARLSEDS